MAKENKGKGSKAQKNSAEKASHAKEESVSKAADEHVSAQDSSSADSHSEKSHSESAAGDKAHSHAAHGDGEHEHKPNRKEYWVIFVALLVLTVLEVAVAQIPGISKNLMRLSLVGMALGKAVLVALFYMHLKHETRVLRWTVAVPLATPALYAVVLISEAAWRLIR